MSDITAAARTPPGGTGPRSARTGRPAPPAMPGFGTALADAWTMAGRCLRLTRRQIDAALTALMLPIMLMVMFVYLFGGAIETGQQYVTYVVPGVIVLCAGYGSSLTAVSVSQDMKGGVIDRFRSMDVPGAAVLSGQVTASVARNIASTVLVIGVGMAIGFRPHAGAAAWLAIAGVLLAFMLAISWLSAAIGLVASSPEAANGFSFFLMFLPYASSAFVPVGSMPSWIHGFAGHQPITPVVESLRGLLLDQPAGSNPWQALAWCGGIIVASIAACGVLFNRRKG